MKPPKPVRLETAPTGRVKVSIYFLNSLKMLPKASVPQLLQLSLGFVAMFRHRPESPR